MNENNERPNRFISPINISLANSTIVTRQKKTSPLVFPIVVGFLGTFFGILIIGILVICIYRKAQNRKLMNSV